MKKQNRTSIRKELTQVFLVVFAIILIVNVFIYYNLNKAVKQVDNVYNSNIQLNDLSEKLTDIQNRLYQYLNTKSTETLEQYYSSEQDYQALIKRLNQRTVDNGSRLREKNIFEMSQTYLEKTNATINAKRGRDVTKYKGLYEESKRIYQYIKTNINRMNTTVFLNNAGNYAVLRKALNYLMVFSLLLLAAVLGLAIVWTITRTRSITKPLIEVADAATKIARGNMEEDFPIVETGDEITAVAKACNKMITSIRSYIRETRENYRRESALKENELLMKNDLKEAQLKYLQAQINPHFLFNSLNAGAQLAMMEGAENACMFIENMADFFRYNVRKMEHDTTLGEELQLIENYIYILNVRFAGDIHYRKSIDERWLDLRMPGMILQPIVENAVNHGLRENEAGGEINLAVYGEEQSICVRVTDDGRGILPETAARIMQGEAIRSRTSRDSAGIGLDNVIHRLSSYYNAEHIFTIRALPVGTEVVLRLPRERVI